jgi:glyceraldehyde 3-phosphate dehydrogenase
MVIIKIRRIKKFMSIKIAINGFGRIGRLVFRELIKNKEVDIVAINDLTSAETLAHLLKYDSAHGKIDAEVSAEQNNIKINDKVIPVFAEKEPSALP